MDVVELCLKVVSNRCRNLKKAIDKASLLEDAMVRGEDLKEEQMESVRAKPTKMALLQELEEILRKQNVVVAENSPLPATNGAEKLSKRAAKKLQRKEAAAATQSPDVTGSASAAGSTVSDPAVETGDVALEPPAAPLPVNDAKPSTGVSSNEAEAAKAAAKAAQAAKVANNELLAQLKAVEEQAQKRLVAEKRQAVKSVLNLCHVVDNLRQPGARDVLLTYFASATRKPGLRTVSGLDIDLVLYFMMMLTSPDGNVPHDQAVEISAAHCQAFLERSEMEAFQGSSYAKLFDIVHAIASCPVLTERGRIPGSEPCTIVNGASATRGP